MANEGDDTDGSEDPFEDLDDFFAPRKRSDKASPDARVGEKGTPRGEDRGTEGPEEEFLPAGWVPDVSGLDVRDDRGGTPSPSDVEPVSGAPPPASPGQ